MDGCAAIFPAITTIFIANQTDKTAESETEKVPA